MRTILYHCPATGLRAQAVFTDEEPEEEGEIYEGVLCPACARIHLVNRATGKVLGDVDRGFS
jgi:hypothetical protein